MGRKNSEGVEVASTEPRKPRNMTPLSQRMRVMTKLERLFTGMDIADVQACLIYFCNANGVDARTRNDS